MQTIFGTFIYKIHDRDPLYEKDDILLFDDTVYKKGSLPPAAGSRGRPPSLTRGLFTLSEIFLPHPRSPPSLAQVPKKLKTGSEILL